MTLKIVSLKLVTGKFLRLFLSKSNRDESKRSKKHKKKRYSTHLDSIITLTLGLIAQTLLTVLNPDPGLDRIGNPVENINQREVVPGVLKNQSTQEAEDLDPNLQGWHPIWQSIIPVESIEAIDLDQGATGEIMFAEMIRKRIIGIIGIIETIETIETRISNSSLEIVV
jgi:hypothetical protein